MSSIVFLVSSNAALCSSSETGATPPLNCIIQFRHFLEEILIHPAHPPKVLHNQIPGPPGLYNHPPSPRINKLCAQLLHEVLGQVRLGGNAT